MLIGSNNLPPIASVLNSLIRNQSSPSGSIIQVSKGDFGRNKIYGSINDHTISLTENPSISSLKINGQYLTLTNNPTPNIGEYYIDYESREITINAGYNADGMTVVFETITVASRINKINNLPIVFRRYIAIAQFNITDNFDSHPSGDFQIRCDRLSYNGIRSALKPGTPLQLMGIDFRVSKLAQGVILDRSGDLLINISLQGYWEKWGNTNRSPLDEPIKEKDLIRGKNDCEGFEYSYKAALSVIGVILSGGNIVKKTGRSLTENQITTGRQLLGDQKRLLVEGYYLDWTSRQAPRLRKWEQPKIYPVDHLTVDLSKSQQFPSITITENGFGTEIGGCYLSHELNGVELRLDQDPNGEQDGDERICLVRGDRNPEQPPQELRGFVRLGFDYNRLRSMASSFDTGELKSEKIETCLLNGSNLEVTENTYGFAFSSVDTYNFVISEAGNISYVYKSLIDIALNVEWQIVKQIKYQYQYDKKTGYFEKKIGKGWKLTRDLQETEDKEAIALAASLSLETDPEAIAALQRHLLGYTRFYKRALTTEEIHELEDLGNHYPDLIKPDEVSKKDFIPSLYVRQSVTEENGLIQKPDPRGTATEPQPPLILGSNSKETQQIEISSTAPEKFITWDRVTNQQGTNLEEVAGSESFGESSGRPSLQNRLKETTGCHKRKKEPQDNTKYLVSTPGVTPFDHPTQTLSYPGAYTLTEALKAANIDYQIKNSKDSCTLTLPIGEHLPQLRGGDVVIFQGKRWRVFSQSLQGTIQPNGAIANSITLQLGKDIDLHLIVKRV